ncbi:MAG: NrfD/PsrC family molybdoenzyme membrane anchor subunit [Chloroflexaceae bacterium]
MAERSEQKRPVGPVLEPGYTYASISDKISAIVLERRTSLRWFIGFGISFGIFMVLMASITYLFARGIGIWGLNVPVGWGFAIVCFVWWIGIGHAGTLISAILLLLNQRWRTSINRFAEAMTLFAVACAGLFPLLHLGRPWFAYWLIPYPSRMGVWPQFRSALVWDFFAVLTYGTVSLVFWYLGLIPDLATLRDRAKRRSAQIIYGILSLGWRGSIRHWHRYEMTYLILAGLATPLVVSVHSIVSIDFAVSIIPGWHSTIFPPYFVAGAIFSGFAMVLTLTIPIRRIFGLQDFITTQHLDNMAKIVLATGLLVAYGYISESYIAWYSDNEFEQYMLLNRMFGPYAHVYWLVPACNVLAIQPLWFQRVRTNIFALFAISIIVNIGMWLERYMIVITSLHRDFIPAAWGMYAGTFWDWATFIGTFGLFGALLFLFIRLLPMLSIYEMRELVEETAGEEEAPPGAQRQPAPSGD